MERVGAHLVAGVVTVVAALLLAACSTGPSLPTTDAVRAALAETGRCAELDDVPLDGVDTFGLPADDLLGALSCTTADGGQIRFTFVVTGLTRDRACGRALEAGEVSVVAGQGQNLWFAVATSDGLVGALLDQDEYVHVAVGA